MSDKFDFVRQELERREQTRQRRSLRSVSPLSAVEASVDGQTMVNFCSNDYLGLARDPRLIAASLDYTQRFGTGATASRLICGSLACYDEPERKLAELKQTESILIFSAGYQTNMTVIPALANRHSIIFSDELNHNSLIQGISLARCEKRLFRHNDLDHLEELLATESDPYHRRLIVTESVFSMDGDRADIDRLVGLASTFDAILVVDEAHATGVLGPAGMGLTVGKGVDVTIGTFGKALGSFGAYVASSMEIRDYLINCCGGFIYTTALPPGTLGAIDAALDLVPTMDADRQRLMENAEYLRSQVRAIGFDTGPSSTQIIPVMVGDESKTLALSRQIEDAGYLASAIRPPTVPPNSSRIRIALSSAHSRAQIDGLLDSLDSK